MSLAYCIIQDLHCESFLGIVVDRDEFLKDGYSVDIALTENFRTFRCDFSWWNDSTCFHYLSKGSAVLK